MHPTDARNGVNGTLWVTARASIPAEVTQEREGKDMRTHRPGGRGRKGGGGKVESRSRERER